MSEENFTFAEPVAEATDEETASADAEQADAEADAAHREAFDDTAEAAE